MEKIDCEEYHMYIDVYVYLYMCVDTQLYGQYEQLEISRILGFHSQQSVYIYHASHDIGEHIYALFFECH